MLKVFAIVFALCVCSLSLSAQTYIFDKGVVSLGGSIGFNVTSGDNVSISQINFSPDVGYFFTKNLEVGMGLGITSRSTTVEILGTKTTSSSSSTFFGPFIRYYFTEGRPILSPYVGGRIGISSSGGSSSTSFGVEGGAAYVVAKNLAILGGLGLTKIEGGTVIGLNIGIGGYIW